jgi:hypothetical protein
VNDAAKNYPRHPNLIHQNRIVNSYTSRQTKRHAVALNALNSQEIDHLMRIMPEVLLCAGIPPAYITPFVIYMQYLERLKTIDNNTSDAQCDETHELLRSLIATLQSLDFTTLSGEIDNDDDDNNNDDQHDSSDDDRRRDGNDTDDEEQQEDVAKQPNWLFPKALVKTRPYLFSQKMTILIGRMNLLWRMRCKTRRRSQV